MKGPSWKYVLLGGLTAGVIMNVVEWVFHYTLLGADWWFFQAVAHDPIGRAPAYLSYTGMYLLKGCAAVWIYALARPRYGPGPRTALIAAATYWVIAYAMPAVAFEPLMLEDYGSQLMRLPGLVALIEVGLGTLAGARLYRETGDDSRSSTVLSVAAIAALAALVLWAALAL